MDTVKIFLSIFLCFSSLASALEKKPKDFVSVKELDPSLIVELKYLSSDNFLGRPVKGYKQNICYLAHPAAKALMKAQEDLKKKHLSLKVFDCYRPQRAVQDFVQWARDLKDEKMKERFYPRIEKQNLFKSGYIASRSGHSRGSTVDLTLVDMKTGKELDMGSEFDTFDPSSQTAYAELSEEQKKNRQQLKSSMEKQGFKNYHQEWWHYSFINEPYPKRYFDFEVE